MCKNCGSVVASAREGVGTSTKLSMFVVFSILSMGISFGLSQNYPLLILGFYLSIFTFFYLLFTTFTQKWLFIIKTKYLKNLIFVKYVTYEILNICRWVHDFQKTQKGTRTI